jgi:hypothetical protein
MIQACQSFNPTNKYARYDFLSTFNGTRFLSLHRTAQFRLLRHGAYAPGSPATSATNAAPPKRQSICSAIASRLCW